MLSMARKKKVEEVVPVVEEISAEPAPVGWQECGHINRHYKDGVLSCDKEKGHAGDHSGMYLQAGAPMRGEWSDAAGTPPAPTIATPEEDYARKHKMNGLELESQVRVGKSV
jgi:hypothetical protein